MKNPWPIVLAVALCGSCLVCGGGLAILGLLADTPGSAPETAPAPASSAPATPVAAPDTFLFKGANGLSYVPELTVVARGVAVQVAGIWRDDRHDFVLTLSPDSTYRC